MMPDDTWTSSYRHQSISRADDEEVFTWCVGRRPIVNFAALIMISFIISDARLTAKFRAPIEISSAQIDLPDN